MKRRKIDSQLERRILTAMIASKEFLGQVAPAIDLELLEVDHFKLIAKWCLDYFHEYKEAPGSMIESIYHSWSENAEQDEEHIQTIHDFLEHLSEQYEEEKNINVPYLLEETAKFLKIKTLSRLRDDLEYNLSQGDERAAEGLLSGYRTIGIGKGSGIDIFNDEDAWDRAFAEQQDPLIKFNGKAGQFMNDFMVRDGFIGIQAPEKRGKTWWCVEFLIRALKAKKKVALFEVGDLSESQILLRLGVRLTGRPLHKTDKKRIRIPKELSSPNGSGELPEIKYTSKEMPHRLTNKARKKAIANFKRAVGIPKDKTYVMTSVHPNSSINVQEISAILDNWATEKDFIPDIIIIDYADILAPEDTRKSERDQINDTWKALRRLSQEKHCLVIAPTQADAASFDIKTQSMKNFANDKRKYGHVTGMLGLNQTDEEKSMGLMRLNWIVLREGEFTNYRCLWVGQSFILGRPICCSTF